jgi:drug/metabolite transporter (DMT)-like permease
MVGELAAILTAFCWAVAARMFAVLGRSFSPLVLNFWKGILSISALLFISKFFLPNLFLPADAYFWLLLSGVIGIGLGDTFFFHALNKIGDSQSIIIAETLAPIFTALLAMSFINEWLTWQQWVGVAIVIFSVDVIIKIQKTSSVAKFELSGYFFAGLAALCQAIGAVVSRDVLTTYVELDAFHASLIRLLGGLAIIIVLMVVMKQAWLPESSNAKRTWLFFTAATLIGTLLALYLQMLSFQHTKAAVVQTLFATSVVLSLAVALVLGEKVSKKTFVWSLTALIGVSILVIA